jgi:LL-diaminopimelate aminotransferase
MIQEDDKMFEINTNYELIASSYLFSTIAKKVNEFKDKHPDREIIKMGIGDAIFPIPKVSVEAGKKALDEIGTDEGFRKFGGYGPEQGYSWLREKLAEVKFKGLGISADEIFVSDGAKCDTANFQELFGAGVKIAVPDPVYPVYVDSNALAGRITGKQDNGRYPGLIYMDCTAENGFVPSVPDGADVIYLCFPNNPTGAVATKKQLKKFVDYAGSSGSLILFDSAYADFIRSKDIPKSIYEIEGARECAVEFRSFSKEANFTGTRCAYTIVPKTVKGKGLEGLVSLHPMWNRRQTTKFNGASYPVQRAAEATLTEEGQNECKASIDKVLNNAAYIRMELSLKGLEVTGGDNSPYVWTRTNRQDSWETFDYLLNEAGVVCTPGSGFGRNGQGYIRFSAFQTQDNVMKAMDKIKNLKL